MAYDRIPANEEFNLDEQFRGMLPLSENAPGVLAGEWTTARDEEPSPEANQFHIATPRARIDA